MLRNAPQWFTQWFSPPRQTHEARVPKENLPARPRARSLRLPLPLGVPPTPWRALQLRARKGLGGAGFPPHPPRGAGSPQSLDSATALLSYAPPPPAAPPPGMGGGLKSRGGRGASPSQVVPGVPRGRTEGTRCLGLCTRSTDRASCSRAAADHAWPREPIGSSLTHLCR